MSLRTTVCTALLGALSLTSTSAAAGDDDGTERRYAGFGGVSYGIVKFIDKPKLEGNQQPIALANPQGTNRSLGADFLLRVGDSNWFAGYAIAFQGGSTFVRKLSVFNTSRTTPNSAACYAEQCFGMTETAYYDVLHVPMEANAAYAWDLGERFNLFVGGGPSIHIAQFTAYNAVSAVQVFEASDVDDPSKNTASSVVSRIEGRSRKYGVGGQIFAGGGVELGRIPGIGGRWGLTLSLRYQKVRDMKQLIEGKYQAQEYMLDGDECSDELCDNKDRTWTQEVVVDGDNLGARMGLVFYF
jgi:hypothetical protein